MSNIRVLKVCYIKTPFGMLSLVPVQKFHQNKVYDKAEEVFALPSFLYPDDGNWRAISSLDIQDWCDINGFEFVKCVEEAFNVPDQSDVRRATGVSVAS